MFDFCFVVVGFSLFVQKHIICHKILQNPFAMLIYLLYLTYCKICDRLQWYKDTDLAKKIILQEAKMFKYKSC